LTSDLLSIYPFYSSRICCSDSLV